MKILLTGSNGFLGKILFDNLRSFDIKTLSRTKSNYNTNLLNNIPLFEEYFELVIHTAGKAHFVPKTEQEKMLLYETNVNGTENLLIGLEKNDIPKKFIFISSVSVYGLIAGSFINEDASLLAQDAYGKSKIEAEKIVINWCEKHNVICTIVRLPLVVGSNPPGNLGAMISGIKKGYYFNIAGGRAKKSMVLASDIAKFIIKASEVGGTYNLTDGYHPTFNELSQSISSQLGKSNVYNMPQIIANLLAKLGDLIGDKFPLNTYKLSKITSTLTFDDSKARLAFGWNPTPVLKGFKIYSNAQ